MPTSEKSKSLNLKDIKPEETAENIDSEIFQTLMIEDVKYKTRLTKKFLDRKPYAPVDPKKVLSFIPGTIKKIYTSKGKKVKAGDKLIDLEAMKMLNSIFADENGSIAEIYVKEGEMVPKGHILILYK
ncbi:MAG: acetyl-CoA carboxylase biotin carboxyl carrier protein subunit [Bacteroidota bacterium]